MEPGPATIGMCVTLKSLGAMENRPGNQGKSWGYIKRQPRKRGLISNLGTERRSGKQKAPLTNGFNCAQEVSLTENGGDDRRGSDSWKDFSGRRRGQSASFQISSG